MRRGSDPVPVQTRALNVNVHLEESKHVGTVQGRSQRA